MQKKQIEKYLNLALSTGAEFAEIYYEDSKAKTYNLIDSKVDSIENNNTRGIGIRIYDGKEIYYGSTNDLSDKGIISTINKLILNISNRKTKKIDLNNMIDKSRKIKDAHNEYPISKKKELLYIIDKTSREYSDSVIQVSANIIESDTDFMVANSNGKFVKSNKCLTRIAYTVYVQKGNLKEHEFFDYATGKGYDFLDKYDIRKDVIETTKTAIKKLDAQDFPGGELPVVIAPGFGAVIFHEACGHGLEATSVATGLSVFSKDYNKKIASDKVTLIDDGTITDCWGSSIIDDEGNPTQKNILIENGILKNYLVDTLNSTKMKKQSNGCGRRQDYCYAPTSRMSNTYLAPGKDKVEDMIKSIELGIYCQKMSGGSVNPATGDFNFAVDTARLIKDGKLEGYLKGITLIGNSKEILKNVEMISDNLKISAGYCGSKSGMVPVTIGQPTIKVSKILVGGKQ